MEAPHATPAAAFSSGPLDEGFQPGRKARKEYKCHACDKVFKRSEHYTRHVRVHTKERPFSCRFCQKTYGRKDLVRRHEKTLHAELCERAALEAPGKSNMRPQSAGRESDYTPNFDNASFAGSEPYSMHEGQHGDQLYSPATDQTGTYDNAPPSLPPVGAETHSEPLMIDPMLENAFGQQAYPPSDSYNQTSPYYHQSAPNAGVPVDPNILYGTEASTAGPANYDNHAPNFSDASSSNPAYGQYDPYQQPYPPDYR